MCPCHSFVRVEERECWVHYNIGIKFMPACRGLDVSIQPVNTIPACPVIARGRREVITFEPECVALYLKAITVPT